MNPSGADGNKNTLLLRQPDGKEIRGGDSLPAVQQGIIQVADNQPDFLSQLSYKILFHA
jgi:hypothetical protein